MSWTLECNGQVKSLADWGISAGALRFSGQVRDTATLTFGGMAFDAVDPLPYGAKIKIKQDGVTRFAGRVIEPSMRADGSREAKVVLCKNVWQDFEETVFCRVAQSFNGTVHGGQPFSEPIYIPHFVLNMEELNYLCTIDQINEILLYAFGMGLEFYIGQILPGAYLYPPPQDVTGRTIGELLRLELSFHPDAIPFFDYATRAPTLHILTPAQMAADAAVNRVVTLDITAGRSRLVTGVELTPLHDKVRPCVHVAAERTRIIDDVEHVELLHETYPAEFTGRETGTWPIFLSLQGERVQTLTGCTVTEPIWATSEQFAQQLEWWGYRVGWLRNPDINIINITEVSRAYPELANELVDGQVANWMLLESGDPITAVEDRIVAKVQFKRWEQSYYMEDGSVRPNNRLLEDVLEMSVEASAKATDAVEGEKWYHGIASVEEGDPFPTGLAQYLFNSVSYLKWAGRFRLVEQEPTWQAGMGNLVNLAGGQDAWLTMNAMVQSATVDLFNGTTDIEVGPPEQLAVETVLALSKVGRRRQRRINPRLYTEAGAPSTLSLGKETANKDTRSGTPKRQQLCLTAEGDATKLQQINFDAGSKSITIQHNTTQLLNLKTDQTSKYFHLKNDTDEILLQLKQGGVLDGKLLKLSTDKGEFLAQLDVNGRKLVLRTAEANSADRRVLTIDLDSPEWTASPQKEIAVHEVAACRRNADGSTTNGFMLIVGSVFYTK